MIRAFCLFLGLLAIGLSLPAVPYSHDEIQTLKFTMKNSIPDLMLGKANEGCNSPLFYILQKPFGGSRVPSIIFMSMAMALIFYAFPTWEGAMAICLMLSLKIILQHYAEVRPYALIVLLTTIFFLTRQSWLLIPLVFTSIITLPLIVFSKSWKIALIALCIGAYYYAVGPHYHYSFGIKAGCFPISNRYFIYLIPGLIIALLNRASKKVS